MILIVVWYLVYLTAYHGLGEALLQKLDSPARILMMHPLYCGSHELVLRKFGEELASQGHNVTQIRWKATNSRHVSGSSVDVITLRLNNSERRYPYVDEDGTLDPPIHTFWDRPRQIWNTPYSYFQLAEAHCNSLLQNEDLKAELRSKRFTVAIVDIIVNECSLALLHHLNIPTIGFWGFILMGTEARYMGVYQSPAVFPAWASEVGIHMSFGDRIWNTVNAAVEYVFMNYHLKAMDGIIKRYLPDSPNSKELLSNLEAVLVQTNWYLDYPKLLPPNVEYIGCLQCGAPQSRIPEDLQQLYLESGSSGVILFSLGVTGYNAKVVPDKIMKPIVEAFSRLPHKIVLRFDRTALNNTPENVMIVDWFPQQDLLADPRSKLLISHCGISSLNEAIYHGIPVICLPIFMDQGDNAVRVKEKNLGLYLDKDNLNAADVYHTILRVLNDLRLVGWRNESVELILLFLGGAL